MLPVELWEPSFKFSSLHKLKKAIEAIKGYR